MEFLSSATLARLRDQLRERGQRPSVVLTNQSAMTPDTVELMQLTAEFGPLCEAMYLMMSADGRVTNDEREVLKGALRNLSCDEIRSHHIEAMLDAASRRIAEQGRERRLQAVIDELRDDQSRAEVALVLAAAVAFADDEIADEENDLLNQLAEGLGIDPDHANELLDLAEADLRSG
jgi:tellurite resistance protein